MTEWAEEREVGPPPSDSSEVVKSESGPNGTLFPPVSISRFEVQPRSAEGSVCEVQPFADRRPHLDWAAAFHLAAEAADDIEWSGDGSAHCPQDDIERVKARLGEIAEATNRLMNENFARAMEIPGQRADVERLLALQAQAASEAPDEAYAIKAPEAAE